MSQELVQVEQSPPVNTGLLAYQEQLASTGLGNVVRLKPSAIKLLQNTTLDLKGAKAGQFLDVQMGIGMDELKVVLLGVGNTRAYYPEGAEMNGPPLCKSDNGLKPSEYSEVKQATNCKNCRHAKWIKGAGSACKGALRALVVVCNEELEGLPRFISFKGVSIPPFRELLERMNTDMFMRNRKGELPQVFDYMFTLQSKRATSKKGAYYQLIPSPLVRVKDPGKYAEAFRQFVVQAQALNEVADDDIIDDIPAPPQGEAIDVEPEVMTEV